MQSVYSCYVSIESSLQLGQCIGGQQQIYLKNMFMVPDDVASAQLVT